MTDTHQGPEIEGLGAPTPDSAMSLSDTVAWLATLTPIEYEAHRVREAKRLDLRVSILDEAVIAARTGPAPDGLKPQMYPSVEPWPIPIDGVSLLEEINNTIRRYIICDLPTSITATLWIAFTWFIDVVQIAPIAIITAPQKRCGKSQFLSLIQKLCRRPLVASNISPAAVYRVIERDCPTLLIDEADSFMRGNEDLRGVLNSGHTRDSAYVIRTVGDDHDPYQFSTWGAKAISGIGHLSGTLMDRSVVLNLRRKLPEERTERLRHADKEVFSRLASMLARFADDFSTVVGSARPHLPDALHDRAQDNWEPLLAIADVVGGRWPNLARTTALAISGEEFDPGTTSEELLLDIREAFATAGTKQGDDTILSTARLLKALTGDGSKPWANCHQNSPMSPRQLASRLREYGIRSHDIKFGPACLKGYRLSQFQDTFTRYLPSSDSAIRPETATKPPNPSSGGSPRVAVAVECATTITRVADTSATSYSSATNSSASPLGGSDVALLNGNPCNRGPPN